MSYFGIKVFDYGKKQLNYLRDRQSMLATNIANSDTPGYKARDVVAPTFKEVLQPGRRHPLPIRKPEHDTTLQKGLISGGSQAKYIHNEETKLSGNNVIIEDQLKMVNETSLLQQQVLAIYKEYAGQIGEIFHP